MTDVRSGHQEILVANFRHTSVGAATVDRAVLADDITVPDFDFRLSFRRKRNVLWGHTDDRAMSDEISAADRNFTFDHDVRLHDCLLADCHMRSNDRKRTDLHIGADFCIRIDDCCRMNLLLRHLSDFDIRTLGFLAYNTPASLKLK